MGRKWTKGVLIPITKGDDFATRDLYLAAKDMDPHMQKFLEHVNRVQCSFRKHFLKIIEDTLRVKIDSDLALGFNKEKAEDSTLQELFLVLSTEENQSFEAHYEELRKFFKCKSNYPRYENLGIERFVFKKLHDLAVHFYTSIKNNDPEYFHREKKTWLNSFNSEKLSISAKKTRAR